MGEFFLYPPIAFLIFLLIGYLIYKFSKLLRPKSNSNDEKLSTYACGENIQGRKLQHGYQFFYIAFFFTILHIVALVVATVPSGVIAVLGIAYIVVALITVLILLTDK